MSAITSGRVEYDGMTAVHKDFRQSSNLIDFITYPSVEDALKEMDIRSDPNNYMISQLSRNMAKHKVESKWTISLVWDGKYKDDMDLEVHWYHPNPMPGNTHGTIGRIYYGNKKISINDQESSTKYTTCLDFDANANKAEAEPSENISCAPYGKYKILVNNYRRCTFGKDIPFSIIINQEGNEKIIIERTWTPAQACGNFMEITEHTFTDVKSTSLTMSSKAASRATAIQDEWVTHFGNPKSYIPNLSNLSIPYHTWKNKESINDLTDSFMSMAVATVEKRSNSNKRRKVYISERNHDPSNITDLIQYMSNGEHTLTIDPRSYSPGYITEIKTPSPVMKEKYSLNHYKDKYNIPNKPIENGNARFDHTWFKNKILPRNIEIESIVRFEDTWFMVINGVTLPNNSDYPLSGGFYPGSLKTTYHKHNYQWTYCNTHTIPEIIYNGDGTIPMIGTFVVSNEIEVTLDGRKIKVNKH